MNIPTSEAFLDYWSLRKVRLQMPPRSRRPHMSTEKPPNGKVETRHVFEDLAPSLRETALRMAEGNPARIRVLSVARFEVLTESELAKAAAAKSVREAVTVHVEKEAPGRKTRSRRPNVTEDAATESEQIQEEAPAENAETSESAEAPKVRRRRKAKTV